MKLWIMGCQTDDYYECIPRKDKCSRCELRFKCFTSPCFDNCGEPTNIHGGVKLQGKDFYIFMKMKVE